MLPRAPTDWPAVEAWLADVVPVRALAETPQDAIFHAEGDVWTHTKMAVEALVDSAAYAAEDEVGKQILAAAVLLHDIGKPATTRLDGDRLTSRGHSARGENLARVALWRQGVPFGIREHVCALIRSHQVPFFGITKPAADADRLAIRLSVQLRNDWLAAVAEADGRGRRCADPADQTRIVEHCALWSEHCKDLGVLDRPRGFASAHTRVVWAESEPGTRSPDAAAYDDTTCQVTLMSGLPASGKDTWIRTYGQGLPAISLDDVRHELDVDPADTPGEVIAVAREQARQYLRAGQSFIWNGTNLSSQLRAQLLSLFRSYRARTRIVYCEAGAHDQQVRNRARAAPVPATAIDRMLGRWTIPDPLEAHEVVYQVATPGAPSWPPQAQDPPAVKSIHGLESHS